MDGYLKIKTKIDNSGVDKDISALENKIKKMQESNSQNSQEQSSLQAEINRYEELAEKAEQYRQKIKKIEQERKNMVSSNPNLAVSTTPEYSNLISQIDNMKQKYADATAELDKQAPKIEKVYTKLDKVKAKQVENNAKISEFKQKIEQINISKAQKRFRYCRKDSTISNRQIRENGNGCYRYKNSLECSKKCSKHG